MKTRFAPSPTGLIHLGNARTALFSALLAMHDNGVFLLRIEDTDMERSLVEHEHALIADLHWLGIDWQEGVEVGGEHEPYHQSKRMGVYEQYYQQLIDTGLAFECYKTEAELEVNRKVQRASGQPPRYPKSWRDQSPEEIAKKQAAGVKPALRFKVPDGAIVEFEDLVKGKQQFAADDIGDFVIRKADGSPSFMFSNAVDDALMGVTHVFRGEDHLTNTPRQLMIIDALKLRRPEYGHISLIMGADGAPLSKRNGSRSAQELRELGFLPLAVTNYMARLGHYYADNDFMSYAQLAEKFNISNLSKSAAKYDEQQLHYWQKAALAALSEEECWAWMGEQVHALVPQEFHLLFVQTIRENVLFPQEALAWAQLLFADELNLPPEGEAILKAAGPQFFAVAIDTIKAQGADFKAVSEAVQNACGVKGKQLFQPLRLALTGQLHGPQMAGIVSLLGMERCVKRLGDVEAVLNA